MTYIANESNSWNSKIEKILNDQKQKCSAYKWLHEQEYVSCNNKKKILTMISIAMVSITGTSNIFTNNTNSNSNSNNVCSNNSNNNSIISNIYSAILILAAFIQSTQHFLKYAEDAENHNTVAKRYTALYNNINRMLNINSSQRQDAQDYFKWATNTYDNIIENSLNISKKTIADFEKKFKTTLVNIGTCDENEKDTVINITELEECNIHNNQANSDLSTISEEHAKPSIDSDQNFISSNNNFKYEMERFMVDSYRN